MTDDANSAANLLKNNNGKAFLSEDASKRVEEPFKVEEAETVKVPPPSPDKVIIINVIITSLRKMH